MTAASPFSLHRHPVAGDRIAALRGLVAEEAGDAPLDLAGLGDEAIEVALLDDDAGRDEALRREGFEVVLELRRSSHRHELSNVWVSLWVMSRSGVDRGNPVFCREDRLP